MKLDEKEIYDLSDLTLIERKALGKYLSTIETTKKCWFDERYLISGDVLYFNAYFSEWLILVNENEDVVPTKNAKNIFSTTRPTTIKKQTYSWADREELRNKWFKRKNSQEESMVRHIQNKKNMTTGELELHINGIHIEQFEKEFEWVG